MHIQSTDTLSNTTFHRRCVGRQKYWWLRRDGGGFIPVPETRGDSQFSADIDLEPGTYILGAGPAGKHGVRQKIEVYADAE